MLKRAPLTDEDAARLRRVILRVVDVGDRREFRAYCRLAKRVVDDGLRTGLLERLRGRDDGRARRALWVLAALGEPLNHADRQHALALIERAAEDAEWFRVAGWVRTLALRYSDAGWGRRILERAVSRAHGSLPALRLLEFADVEPTASQRDLLAERVLEEVRRGGRDGWLEPVALRADSPALRNALVEAYRGSMEDDVRRNAWWAINAIRRFSAGGWPEFERE